MKKEKSILELLQLMLENKFLFSTGLCYWASDLFFIKIISYSEYIKLKNYIQENRPSRFESFNAFINRYSAYFWSSRKIEPRIKWINKHIKIQQNIIKD
jgi:hypothetical protein